MKSRKMCYDIAVSHASLRRFAPMGLVATLGCLLLAAGTMKGADRGGNFVEALQSLSTAMPLILCAYALALTQLLMGDLYNTRLSYGLHSLPVTIGGWFGTQVILGVLSVIPGIALAGGMMLLKVERFRITIAIWMGASFLQFLFFFGVAMLCAVFAANRVGMILCDVLVNFFGVIPAWVRLKIVAPLIFGCYIPDGSIHFCPLVDMTQHWPYRVIYPEFDSSSPVQSAAADGPVAFFGSSEIQALEFDNYMLIMLLYAVAGCLAIALAAWLLHRRKAECAGDLLAFPVFRPVCLLVGTLICGVVFHMIPNVFLGTQSGLLMLLVGLVVGYYIMRMLLQRQVNVFTRKSLLPIGVIVLVVVLCLGAVGMDLFGTADFVPAEEDIVSATIWGFGGTGSYSSESQEDIALITGLQREAIRYHKESEKNLTAMQRIFGNEADFYRRSKEDGTYESRSTVFIHYDLADGSVIARSYPLYESSQYIPALRKIYSQPRYVFEELYQEQPLTRESILKYVRSATLICWHDEEQEEYRNISAEETTKLIDAILADCAQGNAAQNYLLQTEIQMDEIRIAYDVPGTRYTSTMWFNLYPSCENTIQFLEENGLHPSFQQESN